jgi:hypothetical protein
MPGIDVARVPVAYWVAAMIASVLPAIALHQIIAAGVPVASQPIMGVFRRIVTVHRGKGSQGNAI